MRYLIATSLLISIALILIPTTSAVSTPTPKPQPVIVPVRCSTGLMWSPWIDLDTPHHTRLGGQSGEGEQEFLKQEEKDKFCPPAVGNIIDIECYVGNVTASSKGQTFTCDINTGLNCDDGPNHAVGGCYDYKVRYFCQCYNVTKTPPRPGALATDPTTETVPVNSTASPFDSNGNLGPLTYAMWLILVASVSSFLFLCNCVLTIALYKSNKEKIQESQKSKIRKIHPLSSI